MMAKRKKKKVRPINPGMDYFMARHAIRNGEVPNDIETLHKMYEKLYDELEMAAIGYEKLSRRCFSDELLRLGFTISRKKSPWGYRPVVFLKKHHTPVAIFRKFLWASYYSVYDEFGDRRPEPLKFYR
jgi:hypothetical protein